MKTNLSMFREKREFQEQERPRGTMKVFFDKNRMVELHTTSIDGEGLELVSSLAYALQTEEDPFQVSSYFLSIILCFFSDLTPVVKDSLAHLGVIVYELTTRKARLEAAFELLPPCSLPEALVVFGQVVLTLYKNNIQSIMRRRTNALKAHAGHYTGRNGMRMVIPFAKAEMAHNTLSSCAELKREILLSLLASSSGSMPGNHVCNYIKNILAWNEMTSMCLIYDTLLVPRSPVIRHVAVHSEVRHMVAGFKSVVGCAYPQYYKILEPAHVTTLIERSRFPTIIMVARLIKADLTPTVRQFVGNAGIDDSPIVRGLKAIHDEYVRNRFVVSNSILTAAYHDVDDDEFTTTQTTTGDA